MSALNQTLQTTILGRLTKFGGFAKNKSVGPEFGDGCAVETVVTHRLLEAAAREHVHHVHSGPDCSDDAAEGTHSMRTH